MKTNKAIIFDLDGTLVNSMAISISACKDIIKKYQERDLSHEDITIHFGKSEDAFFKHFCGEHWQLAMNDYSKFFEANITQDSLFPRIKEALDYIRDNGIKTAVVTGRSAQSAEIILKGTGIRHYFDFLKPGDISGSIKPRCIAEVLEAWGQDKANAYYIGDIPHDVIDSKKAGVNALSAAWAPTANPEELKKEQPLHLFHSTDEFLDWLKK